MTERTSLRSSEKSYLDTIESTGISSIDEKSSKALRIQTKLGFVKKFIVNLKPKVNMKKAPMICGLGALSLLGLNNIKSVCIAGKSRMLSCQECYLVTALRMNNIKYYEYMSRM